MEILTFKLTHKPSVEESFYVIARVICQKYNTYKPRPHFLGNPEMFVGDVNVLTKVTWYNHRLQKRTLIITT